MLIKQLELSEKDALLDFLRIAYADNPRMSDARFWEWHFPGNPYVKADNLPVWIAKDGNELVGQLAATPVKLKIGDTRKDAIWILDLIVHHNHRGKGLAKKLVLAAQEFCPL
ncbi:MAG TPA: GNAT family N-acetyltransferase, partial [Pyrinomonadaceae bacterium]|nr:GNAT family N-acetyltransferase [Pyrinomonadaceae bacterium]